MTGSLVLFFFLILLYFLISDIITILFRLTGLTEESARFQVVSLLTNSGFTTQESEAVVSSKRRRRLARVTMLFSYTFTVTIVSAAVNFFMSLGHAELNSISKYLPLPILGLFLFYLLRRSHRVKYAFDAWIERIGNRLMFGKNSNPVVIVEDYGEMVVAEIQLHKVPQILQSVSLGESDLMSRHHVMVMIVKKPTGEVYQANASTTLQQGDIIMTLGKRRDIRTVFEQVLSSPVRTTLPYQS